MKPKIKSLFLFENGNLAVMGEDGHQISGLEGNVISDWCDKAVSLGYDPEGAIFETELGNLKIVKGAEGWQRVPV